MNTPKINSTTIEVTPQDLFDQGKNIITNSPEEGYSILSKAKEKALAEGLHPLHCQISIFLSRIFRFQGKHFKSMEYLNRAFRHLNQFIPHDKFVLAHIYKEYGSLYTDGFSDPTTGLNYTLKSLRLDVDALKPHCYNNIGAQYISLEEYDKALSPLLKGEKLCIEQSENIASCFIYENMGNLYRLQKKYKKAIEYYHQGLEACKQAYALAEVEQYVDYIFCYIQFGLAEAYVDTNNFEPLPSLIKQVKERAEIANLANAKAKADLFEGTILLKEEREEEFEELYNKAMSFCEQHSFYDDKIMWYEKIIKLSERQGKYQQALKYAKLIITCKEKQASKTKEVNLSKVLENKEIEILDLENRNRKIQLQKEQLEQFAYIVAHDLRTPITNISNFVKLFSENNKDKIDSQNQMYLDLVQENSKNLYFMFEDLLKYITLKKIKGRLPNCDVKNILSGIIEKHKTEIDQQKVKIQFESPEVIKIQPAHLECIFENLISNAVKFSKKDEINLIKVTIEEHEKEYQFCVSDHGIGIEKEYQQQIFEVFKQLDKINYKGTGMGLALCKKIVNSYGGKIWVADNQMGGASFHFNILKNVN